ncbi:MAG: extracellular solute-binding protein [Phycisphaerales bacterium]
MIINETDHLAGPSGETPAHRHLCDGGPGRARITRIVQTVLLIAAGCLVGCRDDRPAVVLYVSADETVARSVIAAFEREHAYRVDIVTDTEARKTTGLVERLRAERDAPVADVFWSSENVLTIGLAGEGILAPSMPAAASERPESSRDADGRWHAFAARARVIAYAPDRVPEADRPVAWTDLGRDRWRGRVVMADPRFGTTGTHLAAMRSWWDRRVMPGYYDAFLLGLRDAGVRMLPSGNAGAVRAIIDGEADLAMTDTDDVWAARAAGHDIGIIYPTHSKDPGSGHGTLLIPNTVGLVTGGPNPDGGLVLMNYLLSPAVERMLAESPSRNVPMHPSLQDAYPDLAVPDPLAVNWARAASVRDAAVARAMRLLAGEASGRDWPDGGTGETIDRTPAAAPVMPGDDGA